MTTKPNADAIVANLEHAMEHLNAANDVLSATLTRENIRPIEWGGVAAIGGIIDQAIEILEGVQDSVLLSDEEALAVKGLSA